MTLLRRKRLPDGSFGEFEKVFEGETDSERVDILEAMNAELALTLAQKELQLMEIESAQAQLTLALIEKGVL